MKTKLLVAMLACGLLGACVGARAQGSFTPVSPAGGGTALACNDTSGSGTAQSCTTSPTVVPVSGTTILYSTTTQNTGDVTVNVNSSSAVHVRKYQGSSVLASGDLKANVPVMLTYDGTYWEIGANIGNAPSGGGSSITGTSLTQGDIYYLGAAFALTAAEANSTSTLPGVCVAATASSGSTTVCTQLGLATYSGWSWSPGLIYVSASSPGVLTQTAPGSGNYIQIAGYALSATSMMVQPSLEVFGVQ